MRGIAVAPGCVVQTLVMQSDCLNIASIDAKYLLGTCVVNNLC